MIRDNCLFCFAVWKNNTSFRDSDKICLFWNIIFGLTTKQKDIVFYIFFKTLSEISNFFFPRHSPVLEFSVSFLWFDSHGQEKIGGKELDIVKMSVSIYLSSRII